MKTVSLVNWALLACYGILLAYSALTINQSNTDAAGRGLASAYILFGCILLIVLIGVNVLPFRISRLAVLVMLCLPMIAGLVEFVGTGLTARRARQDDDGRLDGSYYFRDSQRRQVAKAIADQDEARVQSLLAEPIPLLNESGEDHITMLDFAALRGVYSDQPDGIIPYLSLLLEKGAAIQTADTLRSPTHALVSRDCSAAMMAWFLEHGADPNAKRIQERPTPILFTVMDYDKDRLEKIRLLLAHGADPNVVYPPTATGWLAGHSALLAAARLELWDVCLLLLDKGADPTAIGPKQLVFSELINRHAELYAADGNTPPDFTALLKRVNTFNTKKS